MQLARNVREQLETLEKSLPEGTELRTVYDQSTFIAAAISEVKSAALIGGLLAILVLYAFLRDARATLIIGIAIPVSVLGTFVLMYAFDLSLNIMSLGGIALAVGMLVDNAVVVLESIVRKQEHGLDRREAARTGHGRGRHGGDRRHADVGGGVLPDGVHHRRRRPAVPGPVADRHVRARVLAGRRADAGADARGRSRPAAAAPRAEPPAERAPRRIESWLGAVRRRLAARVVGWMSRGLARWLLSPLVRVHAGA